MYLKVPAFVKLLICAGIFCFFATSRAQTDVYLKVYTKTFQRMEIDLHPFTSQASGPDTEVISALITEVLRNDLWMSGYFKVNLRHGAGTDGNGADNSGSGSALAVIQGSFDYNNTAITLKPAVVDKSSRRAIINASYEEPVGHERRAIHRISDDIVYTLTGEPGFANSRVAYVHQMEQGAKEIAVMDYDGYGSSVITAHNSITLSPAWSPDGHKICYTSYRDNNPNLYIFNFRTGKELRISDVPGLNSAPAWSPDGRKIALTLSKDGNAELYTLTVDSKKLLRLTYNSAIDSSPCWSPSNRELVFTSDRSGSPQIYVMDSDGLNVRRISYEGSYNDSPSWSPRGDKIAFVSRTDSGFDVYTIDVTGENLMRLTDSSSSNEDPTWAPNGYSIIFSSNRSGAKQLYTMFWDGTDQKKLTDVGTNYLPAWSSR